MDPGDQDILQRYDTAVLDRSIASSKVPRLRLPPPLDAAEPRLELENSDADNLLAVAIAENPSEVRQMAYSPIGAGSDDSQDSSFEENRWP